MKCPLINTCFPRLLQAACTASLGLLLTACVAGPDDTGNTPSSAITLSSSSLAISSEAVASSSVVASSMAPVSSSAASSSSAVVVSSQSSLVSSEASSSEIASSSSSAAVSSSSEASSSLVSSSSSSVPSSDLVSCVIEANLNDGNYFQANTLQVVNDDSREISQWVLTLTFAEGSIENPAMQLYSAGQLLANVSRDDLVITVEGVNGIPAMSALDIPGIQFGSSNVQTVPECSVEVVFDGDSGDGSGGGPSGGPLAPPEFVVDDVEGYLAQFPCGVDFSAMGNGGYSVCYRTEDGGAACVDAAGKPAVKVQWADGGEVTDVLHASGNGRENFVAIVTTDGAVFNGPANALPNTPVIASGAISTSGAYDQSRCALLGEPGARKVSCWKGSLTDIEFPEPVDPVQLSGSYGAMCVLSSKGKVWCWQQGAGATIPEVQSTPTQMPFEHPVIYLSVGQRAVCGTRATGGVDCFARYGDAFFLPIDSTGNAVDAKQLGDVAEVQAGFVQGVVIKHDGSAWYAPGEYGKTPTDTSHFVKFEGVENVIASGGKRYAYCVLTAEGEVACMNGMTKEVEFYTDELKAQAAACPY